MKEIISKLPESEKYDLKDQLSRSTKAMLNLIIEKIKNVIKNIDSKNILRILRQSNDEK